MHAGSNRQLKDEYSEADLEEALIFHLEAFLLELGAPSSGSLEVLSTGSSQNSENVPRSRLCSQPNEDVRPPPARCP